MSSIFRFSSRLQQGVAHTLGWDQLRPVQELTIDAILEGRNCVVLAPTAGGKTEAAFFPILDIAYQEKLSPVSTLYISPLRALLNNQEPRLEELTGLLGLSSFKWHGDVPNSSRKRFLRDPADVLMITPESLEVILIKPDVDKKLLFSGLRFAVIDEIHAFAGSDRGAHLVSVLERLQEYSQYDVQRIGLSATVGNPDEILNWQQGSSERPGIVIDPPKEPSKKLIEVEYIEDEEYLGIRAKQIALGSKSLFFVESRRQAEAVKLVLEESGIDSFVHHSSVGRDLREEVEARFTYGRNCSIVCTSTMELGIDVGDLDLVMQLDAPATVSSFMQRMGRTGRRSGKQAHMSFFAGEEMALLRTIALITLALDGWIEPIEASRRAYHVLVHQTLAQALQFYGVRRDKVWLVLHQAASYNEIDRSEFDQLIDHLISEEYLFSTNGLLALGEATEAKFGRQNFLEMYSVFETPEEFRVVTVDKQDVGMLQSWFVHTLGQDKFVFVLAGRKWQVVEVDFEDNLIFVTPAEHGQIPRWSGGAVLLSRKVAKAHRDVLLSNEVYTFLHRKAKERLDKMRRDWRPLLEKGPLPLLKSGNKWQLFTFTGGRINTLLAFSLANLFETNVANDNFVIDVNFSASEPISEVDIWNAFHEIISPDFYNADRLIELAENLRRSRLSKFQELLPPELEAKFLIDRLFDVEGLLEELNIVVSSSEPG